MKTNNELEYHELSLKIDDLQKRVISAIKSVNGQAAKELESKLKEHAEETKLKIAFVGQHNSGKSTIVTALTGRRDIRISTNVETDTATDYEWNNVLITDTPGLKAGVCEEHDRISLQKIKESDLLVFCITASLFDDLLTADFIDLAYKRMYKSKIFLVINKMSMETGNFDTLVGNYTESLRKSIAEAGGNLADFTISFIDAHDYIEGADYKDDELQQFSHFDGFVNQLNDFIEKNGITSRLDTPCRLMEAAIADEIANTGTTLDKNMMALLRQAESCVCKYRTDAKTFMFNEMSDLRNRIMAESNDFIATIGSEKVDENDCENVNTKIEAIVEKETLKVQEGLGEIQTNMIAELSEIWTSDMASFVINEIENNKVNIDADVATDFTTFNERYKVISDAIKGGSKKVLEWAGGADKIGGPIKNLSGSKLHELVLKIGHYFGKSFRPWEALKIAGKIGKVAKVLGPILSGLSVIIDIAQVFRSKKQNEEIQNAKEQALVQFSGLASDLVEQFNDAYSELEKELFDAQIEEISNARNNLVKANDNNNGYVTRLKELRSEVNSVIAEIAE